MNCASVATLFVCWCVLMVSAKSAETSGRPKRTTTPASCENVREFFLAKNLTLPAQGKKEFFTCRGILCMMVVTCFIFHCVLRSNISIAIVEMIATNYSNSTLHGPKYHWDEYQKNNILGSFFWGFLLSPLPGGRLSEIFGTKIILGTAMLVSSILTIITPLAAHFNYYCVIVVRALLGLALGVSWPSIPPLAVKWVAPEDRAKFMGHTMAANLGAGLAFPLCGLIIDYLNWPCVFYITGFATLVWTLFWLYLVYDSPEQHPRISEEEKNAVIGKTCLRENESRDRKIPWMKILLSGPVWAIIVADFCIQFNTNFILTEMPSYMEQVFQIDIMENGLLSSLPQISSYFAANIFCYVADKLMKANTLSTIGIRKLFSSIAFVVPGLLCLVQVFWGHYDFVSITVFTLMECFLMSSTAGYISNSMDISPTYAGTIFGLAFTFGGSAGYFSSKLVALLTFEDVSFKQWRYVFWTLFGINVVGCFIYDVFASAKVQKWNSEQRNDQ